jgi:site-specific DNA-cytosine methylase
MAVLHITYKPNLDTADAACDGFCNVLKSYRSIRLTQSNWAIHTDESAKDSDVLWRELRRAGIADLNEIDLIVGGPPCQGFSRNGVRQYTCAARQARFYDDPRNHLYPRHFSSLWN